MVTLYQQLKENEASIRELTKIGVVPITVIRDIEMVEKFKSEPEACKECRYRWLAEIYGLKSSETVRKIIDRMLK